VEKSDLLNPPSLNTKKQQRIRLLANGLVTVYLLCIIIFAILADIRTPSRFLWSVPVIVVSCLDIYFLTRSLLQQPHNTDIRLSTFIVSVGATFGFSVWVMILEPKQFVFANLAVVQQFGKLISLLPYPVVIWSLLCLKDCLTVIPEAHAIVAHGPYKYSRHPLYVCYIMWAVTSFMMYPSWPMLSASIMQMVFLFLRLRREERLLWRTFPEYSLYCKQVGLLWKFGRI